ncbi:MAG: hypothetical protein NTX13_04425 [Acidobacteria bacterium]|nr:hypothetical protein [Acidobacteriota bacterium]
MSPKPSTEPILLKFDILSGVNRVEDAFREIAENRSRMTSAELGAMAGIGVLEQFRLAKAETRSGWWKNISLAVSGFYAFLALGVPILGLAAGIAIDIAIFGGAAEELTKINRLYSALSVGSLVFAVGLGIAKQHSKLLLILSLFACLGASFVPADNPGFRSHFANLLPWLKSTATTASRSTAVANGKVDALVKENQELQRRLETGGVGGKPMLADNSAGNDKQALQYVDQLKSNEVQLRQERSALATASKEEELARQDNAAERLGRLFGAMYIFVWLWASQLVIAKVIERGPHLFGEQKEKSIQYKNKAMFVEQLEDPDPERARQFATAAVTDVLIRFSRILATVKSTEETHHQSLFEAQSLRDIQEIGVDLVCGAVSPARGWRSSVATATSRSATAGAAGS